MVASHAAFIRGPRSHECRIAGKYHHDQQPGNHHVCSGCLLEVLESGEGRNCKTWIQAIKVGLTYRAEVDVVSFLRPLDFLK